MRGGATYIDSWCINKPSYTRQVYIKTCMCLLQYTYNYISTIEYSVHLSSLTVRKTRSFVKKNHKKSLSNLNHCELNRFNVVPRRLFSSMKIDGKLNGGATAGSFELKFSALWRKRRLEHPMRTSLKKNMKNPTPLWPLYKVGP